MLDREAAHQAIMLQPSYPKEIAGQFPELRKKD
jgi:hypothetical protein